MIEMQPCLWSHAFTTFLCIVVNAVDVHDALVAVAAEGRVLSRASKVLAVDACKDVSLLRGTWHLVASRRHEVYC